MITNTWKIEQMWVSPTVGEFTDVVVTAAWRCNASDGTFSSTAYGTASFSTPTVDFIPYANLTEQEVLDWCWANGVNQIEIEASLASAIDLQVNPPLVTPALPW